MSKSFVGGAAAGRDGVDSPPAHWLALDTPQGQASFTSTDGAGPTGLKTSHFQVSGLYCAACAGLIEAALLKLPGVVSAEVNGCSLHAVVRWQQGRSAPSAMLAAIHDAGYSAAPDIAVSARGLRKREQRRSLWRLFVAGFCMMQIMMYATPIYLASSSDMTPDIARLLHWASWVLVLPVLFFAATPFLQGAWKSLVHRRISMDLPVALGLVVTFIASTGAAFDPGGIWGHEVYFDSLSMFVFLLLAARYIDMKLRHRMAARLESAAAGWPDIVQRLGPDDQVDLVSPQALLKGDRVRVLVGQAFPADGLILQGHTQADEAMLTGESLPVAKPSGSAVVAGSVNLLAPVVIQVEHVGPDTRLEGIIALMREAMVHRPALMQIADRWAAWFLWGVLGVAVLAGWIWWLIDPSRAVWVVVSILIVTCPCAFSLAAPATWLSAAGALARRGILITRFDALEALSCVDQIVFDKTGTLTEDRMALKQSRLLTAADIAGGSLHVLIRKAGALASGSIHPLSRALVAAAQKQSDLGAANEWSDIREVPGRGLQAWDGVGTVWRLGSLEWVAPAEALKPHAMLDARQLWFGPQGQAWVCFEFEEVLRFDAAQSVKDLLSEGIHLSILSGDQPVRVAQAAAQLGIMEVHGGRSPEEKLAAVRLAQSKGRRVAMVGDGLNDAPVLAQADVSFAVVHQNTGRIAQVLNQADVVLLQPRLSDVIETRRVASKALRIAHQNLIWAAVYNLTCIPLALAGYLPPWLAGLGMALSSLAVVLNAQRVSWGRRAYHLPVSAQAEPSQVILRGA